MNIRTDLAMEAHELTLREEAGEIDGVIVKKETYENIELTHVEITNENGANKLGKAMGTYVTIEAPYMKYSIDDYENVIKLISETLEQMASIDKEALTLVVGVGNREITPDALGPEVISNLLVTRHAMDFFDKDTVSGVCALAPGVLGTTGIETTDIIKGVTERIKPELIIAVDALAAADLKRVATTIQIADTGIQPGAGIGNNRKGINEETLGVKVIAIGVPTVIDAATISKIDIPEAMSPLMVTTNDIDLVIERMAKAVANGINMALHKNMTLRDIESYVG
ncbi:MAG: GPR endopeptidase [Monoglobales bacterium]|jgi:spore protease